MSKIRPFHLAFPVSNIKSAKQFYTEILGCSVGREAHDWVDLNFFGHQISFHYIAGHTHIEPTNPVDGKNVPIPHFGIILTMPEWEALVERLKPHHLTYMIHPYIRFKGLVGEQATMFFKDPNGISLEFKAFNSDSQIFAIK
jgi:extradiol dioxygenase family protein